MEFKKLLSGIFDYLAQEPETDLAPVTPLVDPPFIMEIDFMDEMSGGFEELMKDLGKKGYLLKLRIDPPVVDKTIEGQAYLRADGKIESLEGQPFLNIRVYEDFDFGHRQGAALMVDYSVCAADKRSPLPSDTQIYEVGSPYEHHRWLNHDNNSDFLEDLMRAAEVMQLAPDPKACTRFRGVEMKPVFE